MKKYCFISMTLFFIIGCSSGDNQKTVEQSSKQPAFNDQRKALEKAKEVELILQRGMENRQQGLDGNSQ